MFAAFLRAISQAASYVFIKLVNAKEAKDLRESIEAAEASTKPKLRSSQPPTIRSTLFTLRSTASWLRPCLIAR